MPFASPREAVVHLYLPHFLSSGFSSSHIICVGQFGTFQTFSYAFNPPGSTNVQKLMKILVRNQSLKTQANIFWETGHLGGDLFLSFLCTCCSQLFSKEKTVQASSHLSVLFRKFPVVQWLGLHDSTSTTGSLSSIPGWGTKNEFSFKKAWRVSHYSSLMRLLMFAFEVFKLLLKYACRKMHMS